MYIFFGRHLFQYQKERREKKERKLCKVCDYSCNLHFRVSFGDFSFSIFLLFFCFWIMSRLLWRLFFLLSKWARRIGLEIRLWQQFIQNYLHFYIFLRCFYFIFYLFSSKPGVIMLASIHPISGILF